MADRKFSDKECDLLPLEESEKIQPWKYRLKDEFAVIYGGIAFLSILTICLKIWTAFWLPTSPGWSLHWQHFDVLIFLFVVYVVIYDGITVSIYAPQNDENEDIESKTSNVPMHAIVILNYSEDMKMLDTLVDSIVKQKSFGKKFLFLAFELKTPELVEKLKLIREKYNDYFEAIEFTLHHFDESFEIKGSCSNLQYSERCVLTYFENNTDLNQDEVIFYKFDSNCVVWDNLFREIEKIWVQSDENEKNGALFRCRICWGRIAPDGERFFSEILQSHRITNWQFWRMDYNMTVIAMRLKTLKAIGLTCPGLIAEDHVLPYKQFALCEDFKCHYLNVFVSKQFFGERSEWNFLTNVYRQKFVRWELTRGEVIWYFMQWGVFGPTPEGHPSMSSCRAMRCALWEVLIYVISALMSVYPIMLICLLANLDNANYFDILGMTIPFTIFTLYYIYVTWISYVRIKGAGFGWNSIFVIIVLLSGVCNLLDMIYVLHACIYYGLSNRPVAYNVVRAQVKSGAKASMGRPSQDIPEENDSNEYHTSKSLSWETPELQHNSKIIK